MKDYSFLIQGTLAGLVVIYGMVIGFPTSFCGHFNTDSAIAILIQLGSLSSLLIILFIVKSSLDYQLYNKVLILIIIGFCLGSFIGLSFIASGVWHGIYP